ncbi:MAG: RDD family protein [Pseudomonadota bacterium]
MSEAVLDENTHSDVVSSQRLQGVRTGRIFAFVVDYLIIALLCVPAAIVVFLLGLPTIGLAWGIFPFLVPLVAIGYVAFTLGGSHQATLGMRMNGLHGYKIGGGKIDPMLGALHHVLFLIIQGVAVFLPLLVSLFSARKRLLHDMLLGTYVARD